MTPGPEEPALASSSVDISLAHESWLLGGFDSRDDRHFAEMEDDGNVSDGAEASSRTNRFDVRLTNLMSIYFLSRYVLTTPVVPWV